MAEPRFRFPLEDNVYRVIDGDTVKVTLDCGFQFRPPVAVRLHGIDAPESRTRQNLLEREAGKLVTEVTVKWMADAEQRGQLYASSEVKPKYSGRIIGRLWAVDFAEDATLSAFLLGGGFVREYRGKKREPWPDDLLHGIIEKANAFLAFLD